jgi:hypothetical protein
MGDSFSNPYKTVGKIIFCIFQSSCTWIGDEKTKVDTTLNRAIFTQMPLN